MIHKKLASIPDRMEKTPQSALSKGFKHGLERETIRISPGGAVSRKPHPILLGSALTNPSIKTDFAEFQLEYVTYPSETPEGALQELENLILFTSQKLDLEYLWPLSMPPVLPEKESDIQLACYGSSEEGQKKTLYRRGLGYRYGRRMQTISGVHYNVSFPNYLLNEVSNALYRKGLDQDTRSEIYLSLMRNFNRYVPVLIYLFGASPAIDRSFQNLPDSMACINEQTYLSSLATTLRLSDIGYTSTVQNQLIISLDSLTEYIASLSEAVNTPYPPFQKYSGEGNNQLNDHYLQIENEYYALIRPKQTPQNQETALKALQLRGIDYLEIRCLDIDPFSPYGVSEPSIFFTHLFLFYLLFQDSPPITTTENKQLRKNQNEVSWYGRKEDLEFSLLDNNYSLKKFGIDLCNELARYAQILDRSFKTDKYSYYLSLQLEKFHDVQETPSAKLEALIRKNSSFLKAGLQIAKKYANHYNESPLEPGVEKYLESLASQSLFEQRKLESLQSGEDDTAPKACNEY